MYRKHLLFSDFKLQLFSFSLPPPPPMQSDVDICRVLLFFFVLTESTQLFLSSRSCRFVTPFFGILRSSRVFISAKCCGSFNKFNTYSLRSFYFLLASIFVMGFYNLFNLKKTYAFVTSYNSAKASLYIKLRILLEPKFCLFYIHS